MREEDVDADSLSLVIQHYEAIGQVIVDVCVKIASAFCIIWIIFCILKRLFF
jgi:hypothetical protein